MSYEKQQEHLKKLLDTIDFSDEEEPFSASESEYEKVSDSESSGDEDIPIKKRKLTIARKKTMENIKNRRKKATVDQGSSMPSTSGSNNIDDTIEDVVRSENVASDQESKDEDSENEETDNINSNALIWDQVRRSKLKIFGFSESYVGVKEEISDGYKDKKEVAFYKFFITDDLINYLVEETNRYPEEM